MSHASTVVLLALLATQFSSVTWDAASVSGLHRSELPAIAVGAARARWGCAWLRLRHIAIDSVL